MRCEFLRSRVSAAIACAAVLGPAYANDKSTTPGCEQCEKNRKLFGHPKDKEPKPTCDSKVYPRSDSHYIKQFCGPQICTNACFGYFPTQWRSWDAACGNPTPVAAKVAVQPVFSQPEPIPTKPKDEQSAPAPVPAEIPPANVPNTNSSNAIEPPKVTVPAADPKLVPTKPTVPAKPTPPKKKDQIPVSRPVPTQDGLIVVPTPPNDTPGVLLFGTVPSSTTVDPKR
ncbi:MAG TPA: hypothetical protein VGJ05_12810 [Fimbriiglobus sp.]|jgi:hypothetical protein